MNRVRRPTLYFLAVLLAAASIAGCATTGKPSENCRTVFGTSDRNKQLCANN